jgi:hypothetical protein
MKPFNKIQYNLRGKCGHDTDYADWFVDYEPEYDDLYFYVDTFASM